MSRKQPESMPPVSQSLFQKLEAVEAESGSVVSQTGHSRWMIPYADLLTLLLGLFLLLAAFTEHQRSEAMASVAERDAQLQTVMSQLDGAIKDSQNLPITEAALANDMAVSESEPLAETLSGQLAEGITINREERGVVISLKDNILFAPGSADLTPSAHATVDKLARQLKASLGDEIRPIRVEGHTDNTPIKTAQYPSNWELSTARATNILKMLAGSGYFESSQLSAAGYGEFHPIDDNSSIEGKQKNRRVDIVVLMPHSAQWEPPVQTHTANEQAE